MSLLRFTVLTLALLPSIVAAQASPEEDEDDDEWSLVLALVVVIVALALLSICLIVVICEIRSYELSELLSDKKSEELVQNSDGVELRDIGIQTEPPDDSEIEISISSTSTPSVEEDNIAFGRILDGLYNLTQQFIYGRHATVIKASMVSAPRDVIIKVHDRVGPCLHEHAFYTSFQNGEGSSSMYNEAKVFIPELIDAGQITLSDKSCPALVLEAGQFTLKDFLAPRKGAPRYVVLSEKSTFYQICNSLRFIHGHGYAHGDLHVGSVMFFGSRWKLIDFSCWGSGEKDMRCCSTAHYTAPEVIKAVARGRKTMPMAQAADIWSLGLIAWEIITKKPLLPPSEYSNEVIEKMSLGEVQFPWEGKPAQFWSAIKSPAAAKIIQNCLQRDRSVRWNINKVIQYMKFWSDPE